MFRRAMDYLGLGPDEAYEDYDASTPAPRDRRVRDRGPRERSLRDRDVHETDDGWGPEPHDGLDVPRAGGRRDDSGVTLRPAAGRGVASTVRPLPVRSDPVTVYPERYEDAKELADHFAAGRPVVINVQSTEPKVMRRIVDFASGVCYAHGGQMEKMEQGVFMMRPGARTHRN